MPIDFISHRELTEDEVVTDKQTDRHTLIQASTLPSTSNTHSNPSSYIYRIRSQGLPNLRDQFF